MTEVPDSEILIPMGDWNEHVGTDANGFDEVHGGFGFGFRNAEGEHILEFAMVNSLVVGNTSC